MVLRPTFFLLAAVGPLMALGGYASPVLLQFVWPWQILIIALAIASYAMAGKAENLVVERKFDRVLSVRERNLVRVVLTNDGDDEIAFTFRDEVPPEFDAEENEFEVRLLPGERREYRYHVTPVRRGDFFFLDSFVRINGPLHLAARVVRMDTKEIVRVYPNVLALRKFDLLKQRGHLRQIGIRRSRLKGVGTDFESLREYVSGDDIRKVEWKATARRHRLMVKEYEAERNQSIVIVLDYGRLMMAEVEGVVKLDLVLDAALMLGNAAANANDMLGLLVHADRLEKWLPPARGRAQVGRVIEALHALQAVEEEPDLRGAMDYLGSRWKRRSLVVVFTEIESVDTAKDLLATLSPLARRHLCLVVTVADPKHRSMLNPAGETLYDEFIRASARLYQEERDEAKRLLNAGGVKTLDSEPQDLAADLVNFYMDVKATAAL
ncbi:DUF58 domain-containing protein [Fimbriimonadia bacterium ATM]|nr:MAG: DUF58 domain-containing protein [Armatimonadota bacterium]MBC6970124.1 DUF58 domain-containing protein [Armatimonadota bacterium]MCE7900527.1 DUF58 domain-containing protein [Armatimonadetes bacterium ATM1]MDL1929597.1 DUF58 domain-containing protein [Fimbriimonadia bacterium ATM]RIJ97075.1 MAG: hypothetical protein DCC45_03280 [Armatimonadota bacterium]